LVFVVVSLFVLLVLRLFPLFFLVLFVAVVVLAVAVRTLNEREDAAGMAKRLGLPVILVVGLRLGCLNHALLTQEAIASEGLTLAGWVANRIDPAMARAGENIQALSERLRAPLIAELPFGASTDFPVPLERLWRAQGSR